MKKQNLVVLCATILLSVSAAQAGVNCKLVNRDLELGRTPADISERMGIPVADVQKCKAEGGVTDTPSAAPVGATAPAPGGAAPSVAPTGATSPNK
ncbi:MAG: hypothetical protein ABR587_13260 [Candidatus Binatia bacterium]